MASSALVFESYYLQCLAQASYVVGHKGWAFLIDPRRDTDMYLKELARHGLRLKGVLLTHMHADFVSGNEELRKKLGVTIFLGANAGAQYPHYPLTDGDTLALSDEYDIMAMETPGHTAGCVTYVLRHKTEGYKPIKVRQVEVVRG
jgi:hydroxyacylglutathione hydrolase